VPSGASILLCSILLLHYVQSLNRCWACSTAFIILGHTDSLSSLNSVVSFIWLGPGQKHAASAYAYAICHIASPSARDLVSVRGDRFALR
jgi:hypothetical protein